MHRIVPACLFASVLSLANSLCAQAPTAAADLEVTAAFVNGQFQADGGKGFDHALPQKDPIVLAIICAAGVDCSSVSVQTRSNGQSQDNWTGVGQSPARAEFSARSKTLSGLANGAQLVIRAGPGLESSVVLPANDGPASNETIPLTGAELQSCKTDVMRAARDSGQIAYLVTFTGNVLDRTHAEIDENQRVTVFVRGPRDVVAQIVVHRKSQFRQVGGFPIVGEGLSLPKGLIRESTGGDRDCAIAVGHVENFAGDAAGEVELLMPGATQGEAKRVGTFDFAVNRTYRGAFSLGVLRSDLANPSYVVAGPDSVVAARNGGRRYLYAVYFTPYLWGRRNAEHWSIRQFPRYLNPTVGLVVNDVSQNALAGASFELPGGIFFTAGYHVGKVTRLARGTAPVGATPTVEPKAAVTEEQWRTKPFYSVSLDLRAAVKFLNTLAGGSP